MPDKVVLHPSYIGPQLRRMKEEQLFIILVSVDSLVIFKECMGILERMIRQRKQRFDLSGVISVLCRPCAGPETVLAKTQTVSHADARSHHIQGKDRSSLPECSKRDQRLFVPLGEEGIAQRLHGF